MRHLLFFALLVLGGASAVATSQPPIGRELLRDLAYVRLDSADANPTSAQVIDARYAKNVDASDVTTAAFFSAPPSRTLVLLGSDSPAWLQTALTRRSSQVITLAATASGIEADIIVDAPLADDRGAYDLLATATDDQLTALLGRNVHKRRFDENALLRSRQGDAPEDSADETATTESDDNEAQTPPEPTETTEASTPSTAVPPDLVLQRAVQVYQGLRALGRW